MHMHRFLSKKLIKNEKYFPSKSQPDLRTRCPTIVIGKHKRGRTHVHCSTFPHGVHTYSQLHLIKDLATHLIVGHEGHT